MSKLSTRVNKLMDNCLDETDCWLLDTMKGSELVSQSVTDYKETQFNPPEKSLISLTMYDESKQFISQISITRDLYRTSIPADEYLIELLCQHQPHYTMIYIHPENKQVRPIVSVIVLSK